MNSKYTERSVREDQKLAEVMCERQAATTNTRLQPHFWNERAWKPKFLFQQRTATALLRLYSYECINNVLQSKAGLKINSLKAPWLDELLETEKKRLDTLNALKAQVLKQEIPEKAVEAKTFGVKPKKNIFDELE